MAKQFLGWCQTSISNDVQRIGRGLLCAFLLLFASVLQAAPVLQAEINPNPVQPSELLDAQITIGNPTGGATGQLSLRVLWPEHIGGWPLVTGYGNACSNRHCEPGEYVIWDSTVLGALPAGGNLTVGFTETILSSVADGTVIPFRIELFESAKLVRTFSHSVFVHPGADFDGDGIDDIYDDDDDNDGIPDYWELLHGLNPRDSTDADDDADRDGLSNFEEYLQDSDPHDADSDDDGLPDGEDAQPNVAEPNSCAGTHVVLQGPAGYLNNEFYHCRAPGSITTSGSIHAQPGSEALYMAPLIELAPGFRVENGAVFRGISANPADIAP
ncbi:hypothetical protein [Thiolapillus sp.]